MSQTVRVVEANDVTVHEPLGKGGQASVFRATLRGANGASIEVALKQYAPSEGVSASEAMAREIKVLHAVKHNLVVKVIGQVKAVPGRNDTYNGLLFELLSDNLYDYVLRVPRDPFQHVSLLHQASLGVAFIHAKGYIHGDIKPQNIGVERMPNSDDMRVKIIDFGLCQKEGTHSAEPDVRGTLPFLSRDRLYGDAPTFASDIYALGMTMWCVIQGTMPWQGRTTRDEMLEAVEEGSLDMSDWEGWGYPKELRHLVEDCWNEDDTIRPNAEQVQARLAGILETMREVARSQTTATSEANNARIPGVLVRNNSTIAVVPVSTTTLAPNHVNPAPQMSTTNKFATPLQVRASVQARPTPTSTASVIPNVNNPAPARTTTVAPPVNAPPQNMLNYTAVSVPVVSASSTTALPGQIKRAPMATPSSSTTTTAAQRTSDERRPLINEGAGPSRNARQSSGGRRSSSWWCC